MKVIESLGNILERVLTVIGGVYLLSLTVGICIDVFCRYFFGFSVFIIDDLGAILWVWSVYLLAGVITKNEAHIVADFLSERYSKKGKRMLKLATHFLMVGYSAFVCWCAIRMIVLHKMMGTKPNTQLGLPEWIARLCVLIGFGIVFLWSLELLIKALTSHRKTSDVNPELPESVKEG